MVFRIRCRHIAIENLLLISVHTLLSLSVAPIRSLSLITPAFNVIYAFHVPICITKSIDS